MADIELVIKIPEDEYRNILLTGKASFCAVNAIEAGTPLPKGHGDLVDYEELKNNAQEYGAYAETTLSHIKPKIIIEAATAESEEEDADSD